MPLRFKLGKNTPKTRFSPIPSQVNSSNLLRNSQHADFGVFLASAVLIGMLSGCKSAADNQPGPDPNAAVPVQVATAIQRDVSVNGQWVAVTDGYVNAQIQPQVSGYLIRQLYKEGSVVSKGQILFEIDARPLQAVLDQTKGQLAQAQAQVAQTEAQVSQAQAQFELAEINVNRDTPLVQARATSRSVFDGEVKTREANKAAVVNAKAAVNSAQAAVTSAQAAVEAAELNVGFTKVRSLINGVAGQAMVQVGNLVNQSSVLTSVSQLNPIKVFFSISEQEYLGLSSRVKSKGEPDLLSSGDAIPIHLTLANNEPYPHPGRIIFVDRSMSAQTGSIRLAASFPNRSNLLRPGQFGRVAADTGILKNAIVVPQSAANELQGAYQVVVIDSGNVAHIKTVQVGQQVGKEVVISSGLKAGEQVVTEGNEKLRDGMKVVPHAAGAETPAHAASETPQGI